jgi:protein disulfide-isomerase
VRGELLVVDAAIETGSTAVVGVIRLASWAAVSTLCIALVTQPVHASDRTKRPYDEAADAHAAVAAARGTAAAQKKAVLLVFGANWCPDCRVLAGAMADEPLAAEIAARYVVVEIDVGNWNKNLDVVQAWGNPIAKGIPAIVIADPKGDVLYATRAGELANARRMGSDAFAKFFAGLPAAS